MGVKPIYIGLEPTALVIKLEKQYRYMRTVGFSFTRGSPFDLPLLTVLIKRYIVSRRMRLLLLVKVFGHYPIPCEDGSTVIH